MSKTATRGKPALAHDVGLSFNLAHTDGLVACCVGRDAALGIDVEKIGRRVDARKLAQRFFSRALATIRSALSISLQMGFSPRT